MFLIPCVSSVQAGNIYLLDYAIMDGIPPNTIKGKPQYIAAPICLLYLHPDEGLIPVAIQVDRIVVTHLRSFILVSLFGGLDLVKEFPLSSTTAGPDSRPGLAHISAQ